MQEAKYQIKNWKKWKATKYLLIQTKLSNEDTLEKINKFLSLEFLEMLEKFYRI